MLRVAQVILTHRFVRVGLPVLFGISILAFLMGWMTGDSRMREIALSLAVFFLALQVCGWAVLMSRQVQTLRGTLREQDLLLEETGRIGKIGGWELDAATGTVTWTAETASIHGLAPNEPLDLELSLSLCGPAHQEKVRQAVRQALEEGTAYDLQFEMIMRSGEAKWVRAVGQPMMRDGKVVKLRGIIQDITAQRKTELAARFSENHLQVMTELNPDCVKVIDVEGRLTAMNQAGLALLEVASLEEAQSRPLIEYLDPEFRPAFLELHQKVMGGASDTLEFTIQGQRGATRHLVTQAVPLKGRHGKVNALLGITRDISVQVREKALAEGQREVLEMIAGGAELRATMDRLLEVIETHSPDMRCSLLLVDSEGRLHPCSAPRLPSEYVQATEGVKIGPSVGSCGTAAFRREAVFVEDIASDPLWAGISEFTVGHGLKACWSTPIFDAEGEVLATFAVYYDRPAKPTKEHLRLIELATHAATICLVRHRDEAALRDSEWRFRRVIESIDEIFWMRDAASGKILYVSPKYESLWGYSLEKFYGDATSWLDNVHPEDRERMKLIVQNPSAEAGYDETFRILHPRKGTRWIRSRAFAYRNEDGKIGGRVGVSADVTEQKQLEEQLFKSQRLEAVGTLAGGVAHDLNNILAPILVACGMLKNGTGSPHDHKMVETLEKSAQRGATIIQKLLDFSRGGEGTVTKTDPRALVHEVYDLIRETFPKQIIIKEDVENSLWGLKIDAAHVHQILMNLCVNARDAMPAGGTMLIRAINVEIGPEEVKAHPDVALGRYVLLTVRDDGEGMSAETLDRVFEPFFTTKAVGKGSGLGLASVLGIVKGYRGFVEIRSELDRGTEVEIYLPAMLETVERQSVVSDNVPSGNGELILVVDDEPSICGTIGALLKKHGYKVLTAENGRVALERIGEHERDLKLVVTDMVMPLMDGVALIREMQRNHPDLKIIAASGLTSESDLKDSGVREVAAFMEKPYSCNALLQRIHEALSA